MSPASSSILCSAVATGECRVVFGMPTVGLREHDGQLALGVDLPVLAGRADECLLPAAAPRSADEGFALFGTAEALAGFAIAAPALELEAATATLYQRLFAVAHDLHLHRLWNYVPQINATTAGLENYHRFCRGRSLAFEQHFGPAFCQRLPAASGVGTRHGPFALAFLAGQTAPRHFENPHQVPAFEYPPAYGPRPPSFSRAVLVEDGSGCTQLFISGTAAIRGHATVAPGNLERQLAGTMDNLRAIGATAGADLGRDGWRRTFKVYLRRAADLPRVQTHLAAALLRADDIVSYLHADLCRPELLVEIEAVLTRPPA